MSYIKNDPLDPMFNAVVQTICKRAWPQWFDLSETDAPDTYAKLCDEYERRGRITVWNGSSDRTIFDDPDINIMFRAWHDYCHIMGGFDFSMKGETMAAYLQCNMVRDQYGHGADVDRWCSYIIAEVCGQKRYHSQHGAFPKDQKAFTKAYLEQGAERALATTF